MKKIKLKFISIIFLVVFALTGCTEPSSDKHDFIDACETKPGCDYKVLSNECVCDKTNEYIQGP